MSRKIIKQACQKYTVMTKQQNLQQYSYRLLTQTLKSLWHLYNEADFDKNKQFRLASDKQESAK